LAIELFVDIIVTIFLLQFLRFLYILQIKLDAIFLSTALSFVDSSKLILILQ